MENFLTIERKRRIEVKVISKVKTSKHEKL